MAARPEKTKTSGVYRRGSKFVVPWRDTDGKQRWTTCGTYTEAVSVKAAKRADRDRGELPPVNRVLLSAYVLEAVGRLPSLRDETRGEYLRILRKDILPWFPARRRVIDVTPWELGRLIDHLCAQHESDGTVRNLFTPLRRCLALARREGIRRDNPAADIELPSRPTIADEDDDDGPVKAMTTEELSTLLAILPVAWHPFFHLLACTGARISEAVALEWRHLHLDGSKPCVRVRQRIVRGRLGPPKSRYGRRDIPIPHTLVVELRQHKTRSEWIDDTDPVFHARGGVRLNADNVRSRVLAPAAEEAGVPWVGFHAFRHTCASMLFASGRNAVQAQRFLGHHSAAFTLSRYIHLLDGDVGGPLEVLPRAGEGERAARSAAYDGALSATMGAGG